MWERQIAALGGANYRSGVPRILDDHGEEIPGMRGYRYYGRAKDLPGVKEHLRPVELEEEEKESAKTQKYKRFQNQPSSYFGNDDEKDGVLLRDEDEAEQLGWKNGWTRIASALLLPEGTPVPPLPRRAARILDLDKMEGTEASSMENKPSKKAKKEMQDTPSDSAPLLPALDAQELVMPPTPSRKDIEAFMLQAKKAALRSECTYTWRNLHDRPWRINVYCTTINFHRECYGLAWYKECETMYSTRRGGTIRARIWDCSSREISFWYACSTERRAAVELHWPRMGSIDWSSIDPR